jgi:tRNA modification GTPase
MISDTEKTIVAPATASGEGGIGIVRISGPLSENFLKSFFRPHTPGDSLISHRLYFGRFYGPSEVLVDEVMAVLMRGPRSYTREDVAEIHCHGGPVVMRKIIDTLVDGGARLARPGEFTLRAFLNGRVDLAEAEAVIDLIRSRSDAASHIALGQLEGKLSAAVHVFRDELAEILSLVETFIDFPEEDIEFWKMGTLHSRADGIALRVDRLLATFETGRALREGVAVLILGRPNVGKSSLMNALLGEARAIVTEIPGTTRDTIEENLSLGGVPLRLVDTAGIRSTADPVESEGVRRAMEKISSSDLVLLVIDGSAGVTGDDHLALESCDNERVLLVVNKDDLPSVPLPSPFDGLQTVRVSARTGTGLDSLQEAITRHFCKSGSCDTRESVMLSDRRHRESLVRTRRSLERFQSGLEDQLSPELLALDLRDALEALGEITGETTPDEILERIFSRFCIGK